jgi:hypothetical protein
LNSIAPKNKNSINNRKKWFFLKDMRINCMSKDKENQKINKIGIIMKKKIESKAMKNIKSTANNLFKVFRL